jgi:hypothetical protein
MFAAAQIDLARLRPIPYMDVSPITICFCTGIFTPAIRADDIQTLLQRLLIDPMTAKARQFNLVLRKNQSFTAIILLSELTLFLLMFLFFANYADNTVSAYDFAITTNLLYRCTYFHNTLQFSILSTNNPIQLPH